MILVHIINPCSMPLCVCVFSILIDNSLITKLIVCDRSVYGFLNNGVIMTEEYGLEQSNYMSKERRQRQPTELDNNIDNCLRLYYGFVSLRPVSSSDV